MKNKLSLNKKKHLKDSVEFQRPVFGRNLKYIVDENEKFKKAEQEFIEYVEWNGLKMKDTGINMIARRYNIDPLALKKYLIANKTYDMELGYRQLKENEYKKKYKNKNIKENSSLYSNDSIPLNNLEKAAKDYIDFFNKFGYKDVDAMLNIIADEHKVDVAKLKKYLTNYHNFSFDFDDDYGKKLFKKDEDSCSCNDKKIGDYGQYNDSSNFDYRKNSEVKYGTFIKDNNINDTIDFDKTFNDKENKLLCEISLYVYDCLKNEFNNDSLDDCFKTIYMFILNNLNKIYELFGKTLNDKDKKIVLTLVIGLLSKKFEDNNLKKYLQKSADCTDKLLVDVSLNTGLSLKESVNKIKKRLKNKEKLEEIAPPGLKAERFIKRSKESFRKKYGRDWKKILYATAWKKFKN